MRDVENGEMGTYLPARSLSAWAEEEMPGDSHVNMTWLALLNLAEPDYLRASKLTSISMLLTFSNHEDRGDEPIR